MSEGESKKPVHVFKSTINEGSIKAHKERYGVSGTILTVHALINLFITLPLLFFAVGFAAAVFFHPVCGVLLFLFGVALTALWLYMVFSRKKPTEEAEEYYVEMYQDHLVLHGYKGESRTVPFKSIKKVNKFQREMTKFKDNEVNVSLEQAKRPFIHIATDNANLYLLIYEWEGKEKESVVDVDDVFKFKDMVFKEE